MLLSSCLAGASVAFGRQAAWRPGAFVDQLCARLKAHETGDFSDSFHVSSTHVVRT